MHLFSKRLLILFFLFSSISFFAQTPAYDFSVVDQYARNAPYGVEQYLDVLAKYLMEGTKNDLEKARAVYVWVTHRIRYDVHTYRSKRLPAETQIKKQKPRHVLKSKKGVCAGYSNLFKALCDEMNLPALKVGGYARTRLNEYDRHAWNMVKIDSVWYLLDATWGAGHVDSKTGKYKAAFKETYFLMPPAEFATQHYPNDPLFQLLSTPITWTEFQQNQIVLKKTIEDKVKTDSVYFSELTKLIDAFYALKSSTKQEYQSAKRMLELDKTNGFGNVVMVEFLYAAAYESYEIYRKKVNAVLCANSKSTQTEWLLLKKQIQVSKGYLDVAFRHIKQVSEKDSEYSRAIHWNAQLKSFYKILKKEEETLKEWK